MRGAGPCSLEAVPTRRGRTDTGKAPLASEGELREFLAGVERRAFKQALFAVRDEEAALDIVQDAMLKLAEKYGDKPAGELPMLFQRILQNTIRDHFRRSKVRSLWTTLLSSLSPAHEDPDHECDPLPFVQHGSSLSSGNSVTFHSRAHHPLPRRRSVGEVSRRDARRRGSPALRSRPGDVRGAAFPSGTVLAT